jgi:hypothetical protein
VHGPVVRDRAHSTVVVSTVMVTLVRFICTSCAHRCQEKCRLLHHPRLFCGRGSNKTNNCATKKAVRYAAFIAIDTFISVQIHATLCLLEKYRPITCKQLKEHFTQEYSYKCGVNNAYCRSPRPPPKTSLRGRNMQTLDRFLPIFQNTCRIQRCTTISCCPSARTICKSKIIAIADHPS